MASSKLEQLRKKLAEQNNKAKGNSKKDNGVFEHYSISDGSTAILRFLPSFKETERNPYFWVDRQIIEIPFNGVKGKTTEKLVAKVPCMNMYGKNLCPITNELKPFWKGDEESIAVARIYYPKFSYLLQGFVVKVVDQDGNPIIEENKPENPIRRFIFNKKLIKKIEDQINDPDLLEEIPTDYERGKDFRIKKEKVANYSNYDNSTFMVKERRLTDSELEAIDQYGLFDLEKFLPMRPTEEQLKYIYKMFQDSLDGKAYDPEKYNGYCEPYVAGTSNNSRNSDSDEDDKSVTKRLNSRNNDEDDRSVTRSIPSTRNDSDEDDLVTSSDARNRLAEIRNRVSSNNDDDNDDGDNDRVKSQASTILDRIRNQKQ